MGQLGERFLPAQIAHLERDELGDARLRDAHVGAAEHRLQRHGHGVARLLFAIVESDPEQALGRRPDVPPSSRTSIPTDGFRFGVVAPQGFAKAQAPALAPDDPVSMAARVVRDQRVVAGEAAPPPGRKAGRHPGYRGNAFLSVPINYAAPGAVCEAYLNGSEPSLKRSAALAGFFTVARDA